MFILNQTYHNVRNARQFRGSLSFVQKILKQYKETGNIAPKIRTQQTPTKLNHQHLILLEKLVEERNDATCLELRNELASKTGVTVCISTVHRMLQGLKLTLKKTFNPTEKGAQKVQESRL